MNLQLEELKQEIKIKREEYDEILGKLKDGKRIDEEN